MIYISVLKIDLNAIVENIKGYKSKIKDTQKFCAVVKADAYGLGAKKICKEIDYLVDYFAVSSEKEFFEIKEKVSKPIIILDPIYENITKLARCDCEFCVSNFLQFDLILKLAEENKDVNFKIHVAFNTGMNRFGFRKIEDVINVFNCVKKTQNVFIFGVISHFYCGNIENFVKLQSRKFEYLKLALEEKFDVSNVIFHIANTSGFEREKEFDMFRIGLGLFCNNNNQAFSIESKIIEIQEVKSGECVGYGYCYFADKKMKVGVVGIGYADGVLRKIAKRGYVLVNEKYCLVLAVCMDSIIIDLGDSNAKIGDTVTLVGKNGEKQIFICDCARWCDTIEYEIMTRISKRVKRVYIGGKINANHNRKISC